VATTTQAQVLQGSEHSKRLHAACICDVAATIQIQVL
jgi:hypothetical protein